MNNNQRLLVLEMALCREFPDLGWEIWLGDCDRKVSIHFSKNGCKYGTRFKSMLTSIDDLINEVRTILAAVEARS